MGAKSPQLLRSSLLTAACLGLCIPAAAQPRYERYSQKLAPYVPSPQRVVERMLDMAAPKPGETVYDLGCGDGRVLVTAAQRFNTRAVGIEVDDRLVRQATDDVLRKNLQDRIKIIQGDLLQADLSGADVVVLYLLTGSNELLRPRLEKMLKPGTRVVSYAYKIPGWKAQKIDRTDEQHGHEIYLYVMPPTRQ